MLPLLWCRQSQPGVYTSTGKPCGSEGNVMQVTEGLYVFNVRISLYERIALYTDNFICKHISSCMKRTQVFLCSQAWACRGKVRKLNIYNIFILFSHFSCCEVGGWQIWHYQYFHLLTSLSLLNCDTQKYLEISPELWGVTQTHWTWASGHSIPSSPQTQFHNLRRLINELLLFLCFTYCFVSFC